MVQRHGSRQDFRLARPAAAATRGESPLCRLGEAAEVVALVVPFREQKEQSRTAQLRAFERHMGAFLRGARFLIVVVTQSDDGRKFNRGQLLNIGFVEARRRTGGALASVIFHDVDLLPSPGLLPFYASPPHPSRPTHLAGPSTWTKYALPGYEEIFFGGVTAFHPPDFDALNGFPNDHWGWGMEDDQLRLRAQAAGAIQNGMECCAGVLRPPAGCGSYTDLDGIRMLQVLNHPTLLASKPHMYNEMFLHRRGPPTLEDGWRDRNGLRDLSYRLEDQRDCQLSSVTTLLHITATLSVPHFVQQSKKPKPSRIV